MRLELNIVKSFIASTLMFHFFAGRRTRDTAKKKQKRLRRNFEEDSPVPSQPLEAVRRHMPLLVEVSACQLTSAVSLCNPVFNRCHLTQWRFFSRSNKSVTVCSAWMLHRPNPLRPFRTAAVCFYYPPFLNLLKMYSHGFFCQSDFLRKSATRGFISELRFLAKLDHRR